MGTLKSLPNKTLLIHNSTMLQLPQNTALREHLSHIITLPEYNSPAIDTPPEVKQVNLSFLLKIAHIATIFRQFQDECPCYRTDSIQ